MKQTPRRDRRPGGWPFAASWRRGFTLTELVVVITIIGIIITFLLVAAQSGIRSAEQAATQTLIAKLEGALNDRLEALMEYSQDPTLAHQYLAWVYPPGAAADANTATQITNRAYVIAMIDYIKREIPDVFFVDPTFLANPGTYAGPYPLNFAANKYIPNAAVADPGDPYDYILPLGVGSYGGVGAFSTGDGIYGATYLAAGGIYKNLGYLPTGYDSVNNNIATDLFVDDWGEGVSTSNSAQVVGNLQRHTHNTARSEMLYAILVEGRGPFGSSFNRDDFTDKEVRDTDGDGLPEFIDAWGQPLQFYRWPLYYHSDLQRGQQYSGGSFLPPYVDSYQPAYSVILEREQNPLDPNQQLVAPAWWSSGSNDPTTVLNGGTAGSLFFPSGFVAGGASLSNSSQGVAAFEFFFHSLHEPFPAPLSNYGGAGQFWDRSAPGGSFDGRRAFYTKFLIVSSGPDKQLGIFQYPSDAALFAAATSANATPATMLLMYENPAPQFDPTAFPKVNQTTLDLQDAGQDDISNHALQAGGTGGGSAP